MVCGQWQRALLDLEGHVWSCSQEPEGLPGRTLPKNDRSIGVIFSTLNDFYSYDVLPQVTYVTRQVVFVRRVK